MVTLSRTGSFATNDSPEMRFPLISNGGVLIPIAEIIGALYCADSAERNNSKYPFVAEKAGTKAMEYSPEALFSKLPESAVTLEFIQIYRVLSILLPRKNRFPYPGTVVM